jgi:hypothetical protein
VSVAATPTGFVVEVSAGVEPPLSVGVEVPMGVTPVVSVVVGVVVADGVAALAAARFLYHL